MKEKYKTELLVLFSIVLINILMKDKLQKLSIALSYYLSTKDYIVLVLF